MTARAWIGKRLRYLADRIDYRGAPRRLSTHTFTLEADGVRFREDGRGCRLWYLGEAEYNRAHTESDLAEADRARILHLIDVALSDGDPDLVRAAMAELNWSVSP